MKINNKRIKNFIIKKPEYILVKNKHKLNVLIMKSLFPQLKEISDDSVYEILKTVLSLDRDVRKVKEELKDDKQLSISASEDELLTILQQEKMLGLGYEPSYNKKIVV